MKKKNEPFVPPASWKFILAAIFIVLEIILVKKWEENTYSVENSSFPEFQFSKKTNKALTGPQELNNKSYQVDHILLSTTKYVKAKSITVQKVNNKKVTHETDTIDIQKELKRRLQKATAKKVILIWVPMFRMKKKYNINSERCGNCETTIDRERINDTNVGAVVFHFDALKENDMPPHRNLSQLYIYWDKESTASLRVSRNISLDFEDKFKFNATMTYRRDSDFYATYKTDLNAIAQRITSLTLAELIKKKTKSVVAVVSNCGKHYGPRTRIKLLKELLTLGINMEGYGKCFKNTSFANGNKHGTKGFAEEVRKYKFYLSFENSYHCKDYISEKFFNNALLSLSVPVVWGAKKEDYQAFAPPGSYIHAEDFASMKDLADHLKYLMRNDTAYLEYFSWITMKPSEMPLYGRTGGWCQVCRALHGINIDDIYNPKYNKTNPERPLFTDGVAQRTIQHIKDWFYGEDNPECFRN